MARRIVIEFLGKDTSAGSTAAKVEQKFGKLGGKLDHVGQVAGKLLAGGMLAGGAAMVKFGQAAADDEAAASRLSQTLRNATGATSQQVAATESWITAQGKALGVTDDELRPALARLAVATKDVGAAQDLAGLAMDVSAGSGKSLEQVSTALAKAQNGNLAGLGKLGVAAKDADGKTRSLKDITAELAQTYSGAASTAAETTAGKQKRLMITLSELGEEIGTLVLPVMQDLTAKLQDMVGWVDNNRTTVAVFAGVVGGFAAVLYTASLAMRAMAIASGIASIAAGIHAAATGAGTAALVGNTIAMNAFKVATAIGTAAQWAFNAAMLANPLTWIVIAIVALVAAIVLIATKTTWFQDIWNAAWGGIKGAVSAVWNWIKANWPMLLAILTGPIGLAVLAIVKNWDKMKAGATAVKEWIADKFNQLVGFFQGLPSRISKAAGGMWDGIKNAFRSALNWIVDKWNALDFGIPSFNIPGIGKFGGISDIVPDVRGFARGTRSAPAGWAKVGEQGPELVRFGGGEGVYTAQQTRQMLGGGGGGGSMIVQLQVGARVIEQVLIEHVRSTGRPLQVKTLGPA